MADAKHHFEVALEQEPRAIDALTGLAYASVVSVAQS
jgi:hypothetical protein